MLLYLGCIFWVLFVKTLLLVQLEGCNQTVFFQSVVFSKLTEVIVVFGCPFWRFYQNIEISGIEQRAKALILDNV